MTAKRRPHSRTSQPTGGKNVLRDGKNFCAASQYRGDENRLPSPLVPALCDVTPLSVEPVPHAMRKETFASTSARAVWRPRGDTDASDRIEVQVERSEDFEHSAEMGVVEESVVCPNRSRNPEVSTGEHIPGRSRHGNSGVARAPVVHFHRSSAYCMVCSAPRFPSPADSASPLVAERDGLPCSALHGQDYSSDDAGEHGCDRPRLGVDPCSSTSARFRARG